MKIKKYFLLNYIGIFLIALGLIRVSQLLFFGVPAHIFWFCNHILIFMGAAILFRNSFLLIGEFSLLFVGQFSWIVGFVLYSVFGVALPGSSAYLLYDAQFINLITILVHFLTLPLGLWAIIIIGKKEKFAWVGGLIHVVVLLPFIIYFGAGYNLNCFYEPCFTIIPNFRFYSLFAIPLYFVLFVIPINLLINWIVRKKSSGYT